MRRPQAPARRSSTRGRRVAVTATTVGLVAAVGVAPAAGQDPDDPWVPQESDDFAPLQDADGNTITVVDQGITDDADAIAGNDYAWKTEYPARWDDPDFDGPKVLVLYAHGFVGPVDPATGDPTPLVAQDIPGRALLPGIQLPGDADDGGVDGLAWAASSYSANGYVIDDPVDETAQMVEVFDAQTGHTPDVVHIMGFSMGGHITGVAVERYPGDFTGALPACGVMGDQTLFDYFADVNLLGQALSGQTPDSAVVPANYLDAGDPDADPPRPPGPGIVTAAALGLFPAEDLTPQGHVLGELVEHESGGERPFFDTAWDFWNGPATAIGPLPFLPGVIGGAISGGPNNAPVASYDNTDDTYTTDGDGTASPLEAMVNEAVVRDPADDGATPAYPAITGEIGSTKVLTLHTIGDLFVPLSMQQDYAQRVSDAGLSDQLVQRAVRGVGHCTFSGEELGAALGDLLGWVATDVAPDGDDLLDRAAVADRRFGCDHTIDGAAPPPDRALVPSCEEAAAPPVDRAAGADRYETAVAAARDSRGATDVVVLASGTSAADPLAASSRAGGLGAPLVLTAADVLPAATAAYLADPAGDGADDATPPSSVVVVGGSAAVSDDVVAQVEAITGEGSVTRLFGTDRFATAAAVARAQREASAVPVTTALLARADVPADAVAASALSAFTGWPLLLATQDSLPSATAQELETGGYTQVVVVGGEAAIGAGVEAQVAAIVGDTDRVAGADRYATSAGLLALGTELGMDVSSPWLADGRSFADALVAGPAAAAAGQGLGLLSGDTPGAGDAVVDALAATGLVERVTVAGGAAAVSDAVLADVASALTRS